MPHLRDPFVPLAAADPKVKPPLSACDLRLTFLEFFGGIFACFALQVIQVGWSPTLVPPTDSGRRILLNHPLHARCLNAVVLAGHHANLRAI